MDIYDKLLQYKNDQGLSWDAIGNMVGKSGDAARKAISRRSLSKLEIEAFEKYFRGGQMSDPQVVQEPAEQFNRKEVPYYDIDFTLSFIGIENTQQAIPDTYVSHPFFQGCDYIVRASGQSMAKIIRHGDAIGLTEVKNWHEFLPLGEVYAIVTDNGFRMVKVITKGMDDDHFTLLSKPTYSKREEFPPQQIHKKNILKIFKVQASSHLF